MKTAKLDQSMHQTPTTRWRRRRRSDADHDIRQQDLSPRRTVLPRRHLHLRDRNALIRSYFSSTTAHTALVVGVFLLLCCGLAVAVNGASMRRTLTPSALFSARAYLALRVTECLTLVGVGVYFLTNHARLECVCACGLRGIWFAGLVLSSALLTSRVVPMNLSMLGRHRLSRLLAGKRFGHVQPHQRDARRRDVALVIGGLFELILPMWLFTKGFTCHGSCTYLSAPTATCSV